MMIQDHRMLRTIYAGGGRGPCLRLILVGNRAGGDRFGLRLTGEASGRERIPGRYPPATRPSCVSYSYTVRACLIVTVHGSISCTDPLRPARRSTYRIPGFY